MQGGLRYLPGVSEEFSDDKLKRLLGRAVPPHYQTKLKENCKLKEHTFAQVRDYLLTLEKEDRQVYEERPHQPPRNDRVKAKDHFKKQSEGTTTHDSKKSKVQCSHCGKIGHVKDQCWKLKGSGKDNRKKSEETHAMAPDSDEDMLQLTPTASKLCTIVLPWGKYEYC
jgi:hypothetical protein